MEEGLALLHQQVVFIVCCSRRGTSGGRLRHANNVYFGGVFFLVAVSIFLYNWKQPTDDWIPSIPDSIKYSKLVWGFWHTGERAKHSFKYGSVKRVLLLEPNTESKSFQHILEQTQIPVKSELVDNIHLTSEYALKANIPVRWHNDSTVLSFSICDPTPGVELVGNRELVQFSKNAYVIVQVIDHNLDREEWSLYKKTMAKDKYAFNAYVDWFKNVWDNKSKEGNVRVSKNAKM